MQGTFSLFGRDSAIGKAEAGIVLYSLERCEHPLQLTHEITSNIDFDEMSFHVKVKHSTMSAVLRYLLSWILLNLIYVSRMSDNFLNSYHIYVYIYTCVIRTYVYLIYITFIYT